jgi:N-acetylglucosaminyl-diphospho-decaprenol L-rhamnosyltransferase
MGSFALVVVAHDSESDLRRLLASMELHLRLAPRLIVVDTGSRDASVEVARAAGARVVLREENPGFGAANNAGVAAVREEVTVLLNPDVELLDDGLARLAAAAAGRRALFAPRLLNPDGSAQRTAHPLPGRVEALGTALFGPALPPPLRVRAEPWRAERERAVGWVIAAALAARTEMLRGLGPFDPSIFLFYEDMDLCLRARAAGVPTILVPGVRLVHRGGHSTGPAYGGEPFALLAERRRWVVQARLGARAGRLDDLAQGLTFVTRIAARRVLGRPAGREQAQLAALRAVRAGRRSSP